MVMLSLSCKIRGFMRKIIYTLCIHSICWRADLLGCFRNKPPRQLRGRLLFHNVFKRILHSFWYESVVVGVWGF